ncbi:hypothetical protein Tcan_19000 [Toxocara canis]|uniref:Uncharacterized protein n=1 Tax=Toxocara canis TaxID=6265 RepID=A0A0B2VXH9_TOXCA|nr:hypothetical protein Tcan_19000 [Toxocara canis]
MLKAPGLHDAAYAEESGTEANAIEEAEKVSKVWSYVKVTLEPQHPSVVAAPGAVVVETGGGATQSARLCYPVRQLATQVGQDVVGVAKYALFYFSRKDSSGLPEWCPGEPSTKLNTEPIYCLASRLAWQWTATSQIVAAPGAVVVETGGGATQSARLCYPVRQLATQVGQDVVGVAKYALFYFSRKDSSGLPEWCPGEPREGPNYLRDTKKPELISFYYSVVAAPGAVVVETGGGATQSARLCYPVRQLATQVGQDVVGVAKYALFYFSRKDSSGLPEWCPGEPSFEQLNMGSKFAELNTYFSGDLFGWLSMIWRELD